MKSRQKRLCSNLKGCGGRLLASLLEVLKPDDPASDTTKRLKHIVGITTGGWGHPEPGPPSVLRRGLDFATQDPQLPQHTRPLATLAFKPGSLRCLHEKGCQPCGEHRRHAASQWLPVPATVRPPNVSPLDQVLCDLFLGSPSPNRSKTWRLALAVGAGVSPGSPQCEIRSGALLMYRTVFVHYDDPLYYRTRAVMAIWSKIFTGDDHMITPCR